ncbi:MAG: hypothetical protein HFE75_12035 [Firmicutes bacterium]|jgi:flagellar assembly protein FliH|nr:hypothetical protein [Bacillota bacterium]
MTSLLNDYRILRGGQAEDEVVAVGTKNVFQSFDIPEPISKNKEATETSQEASGPPPEEVLLQEAINKAESLLEAARTEAEDIRDRAYQAGYEEGKEDGWKAGEQAGHRQIYEEEQAAVEERLHQLAEKIGQYVSDMEIEKTKILEEYLDDLKNISLAIGEKIVQTSLKSSSDVVKRMIVAATEKLKKTAWAKIYVAKTSEEMDIQGDVQLLKQLAKLSDNVKIVVMEDAEPGTCIVELPQEIIDISTGAQMENIRDILNNARL